MDQMAATDPLEIFLREGTMFPSETDQFIAYLPACPRIRSTWLKIVDMWGRYAETWLITINPKLYGTPKAQLLTEHEDWVWEVAQDDWDERIAQSPWKQPTSPAI
jgi:hypothetical protein